MTHCTCYYRRLIASFLSVLLGTSLFAQTATTASSTKTDAVELSPFQVTAERNNDYGATETMTGSRTRTKIIDLPYTVNVMTSEYLKDFGIFDLSDNITQIGSFTGLDVGGNFVLRGFTSSNQLRDGFFRLGRYGTSNIDRIEIIKGANASVYGRSAAGGMMNMISKAPKSVVSQEASYNFGDYGTKRFTFEATGSLFPDKLGKTNYVFTVGNYKRDFDVDFSFTRSEEYYLAVDHVFHDNSKLTLSVESFHQDRESPLSPSPLIIDQKGTAATTDDVAVGFALGLGRVNAYGPRSQLDRGNTSFTGIYEKTFNNTFSARISSNAYMARRDDWNQNQNWQTININKSTGLAPTSQRGSNTSVPQWGRIFEDGGAFQADLLAHYWTNNHKVEHRTLATFDFNDYYRWDPTISYSAATNPDIVAWNKVRTFTLDPVTLLPVAPLVYFTNPHDPVNGLVPTRKMKRRTTVVGGLLRQQSAFFDGRMLAYAGVRADSLTFNHRDFLTAAAGFQSFIPGYQAGDKIHKKLETAVTPNFGVNYKLKENLRVYANYAESYFVPQGDNPIDVADPTYKAETAQGWDYGFKGSIMDDKISYTVSGFYINRQNVQVADIDPITGLSFNRRDGDQLVRGFEADVSWRVTDELSFLGSYGDVHSIVTNFGSANPQAVGRKAQFVAPYNGSLSTKYRPTHGRLKGFSANASVTFVGKTPTETPIAGDVFTTVAGVRTLTSSTGQFRLTAPAYKVWSFGVRYQLKSKFNSTHTFAINVNNAFDENYFKAGTSNATRILAGDKQAVFFTYTINHKGGKF